MENTTVEEKKTVIHEVAKVPAEVGTSIVDGVEIVGHEVAKVVVEGATVVVDTTKTAVSDIAMAAEQLGRDVEHAVSPTHVPMKPFTATAVVASEV